MEFHTFGNRSRKAVILVHGVMTPWQIWEPIAQTLSREYYVVIPALDGHVEEYPSPFLSLADEVQQIERYIRKHLQGEVHALCGLSMGGAVCWEIYTRGICRVEHLVMDGAPLIPMPGILRSVMTRQYIHILRQSRCRSPRLLNNFTRYFLPEQYLIPFLKIMDLLEEESIQAMIRDVGAGQSIAGGSPETGILYFYGTTLNERYSLKTGRKLRKAYPQAKITALPGYSHGELTIYHPELWLQHVRAFLGAGSERSAGPVTGKLKYRTENG